MRAGSPVKLTFDLNEQTYQVETVNEQSNPDEGTAEETDVEEEPKEIPAVPLPETFLLYSAANTSEEVTAGAIMFTLFPDGRSEYGLLRFRNRDDNTMFTLFIDPSGEPELFEGEAVFE